MILCDGITIQKIGNITLMLPYYWENVANKREKVYTEPFYLPCQKIDEFVEKFAENKTTYDNEKSIEM